MRTTTPRARVRTAVIAAAALLAPMASAVPAVAAPAPASCADVAAADPTAVDGTYTLTTADRTFDVWCADLATAPTEYLALTEPNTSQDYDATTTRTTTYTRVRLLLATATEPFRIDATDTRFSTTSPGGAALTWGRATTCRANTPTTAVLDLTGTPFSLDAADLEVVGNNGRATVTATPQRIVLTETRGSNPTNCAGLAMPAVVELGWDGPTAPGIVTQPAPVVVTPGQDAVVTVEVSGKPAPTVQWQRLGADETWTDIPGATGTTLRLPAVTRGDDGAQVRAVVSNELGTVTTSSATVSVSALAPVITLQPESAEAEAGEDVDLSVDASGDPAPTLQWQRLVGEEWTDLAGETGRTLTLTVTTADDGAAFRAVATNEAGSATSGTAVVTVTASAPMFTLAPQDVTVSAGADATFTVTATGDPTPGLQWESSTDGTTWTAVAGATGAELVVADVTYAMSGTRYRVVATNATGSVPSAAATLTVQPGLPSVSTPAAASVVSGADVTFTTTAAGDPAPTLQWQQSADGVTWTAVPGATGTQLVLADVTTGLSGTRYRVVATSAGGTVTSGAAVLTVAAAPPVVVQAPTSVSVHAGQPASFTASGAGDPVPAVTWETSRDGGTTWTAVEGVPQTTLTLAAATPSDDGLRVRARLTSAGGSVVTAAATLTVRPSAFDDVQYGAPFYLDIQWLADEELSEGTVVGDEVHFRAPVAMSRQAMAAFLYRYADADWTPAPGTQTFPDVPEGHPFHTEVEWMVAQGYATGYVDGQYKPTAPVSRQAMAAFLHRIAGEPVPQAPAPFADVAAGHPFGVQIAWLAEVGVTTGYDDDTFRGTTAISRQAMAAFLHRFDALPTER